ncbi:MAG: SAM-dependent methyltransferase [Ferrovum sp. 37-45-19]|jgi:SAM-dependent methyltransferase|uniref:class I SAM-dependent methyltransferase n=1 Tax=Ferrovum sp. JA12 TaxID=1356299 RepID=UPI0007037D09|nr:class I SAM-dependent methyltransferase [Ferrovum sp. JA12]OYV79280.1 MAG: SAM-dependent methyltransferase [Ferrovum sp. 21-44-67]OYV94166.1 MAG: SAM-dependent methyltransferase [Ferrovum sp. 37-45-19]OZB32937.1 MAG: SAM-dependent methyltransferase [Ferrovum sp. 34-44-207]HQT81435.1 class I SAM-dependent methyltransferase [Ferrovaceae bacterium]KRH78474.1 trans-aconitate 2-methyltransferase [Ferrovum sp. JA12]
MYNWFTEGAQDYAAYRPHYPEPVAQYLASLPAQRFVAVDVGCGSGQFTQHLKQYFALTLGLDPSFEQLQEAFKTKGIFYHNARAEQLPLKNQSVDLISAAQAAHWFDLDVFYKEVKRVLKPEAVIALISYGVLEINSSEINQRVKDFYYHDMSSYWPAQRKLVAEGYQTIPFPFNEVKTPYFTMTLQWDLNQLIGYILTWSACKQARLHQHNGLHHFFQELTELWIDPSVQYSISWPVRIRAGRLIE